MATQIDRTLFYSGGFFLVRAGYPKWGAEDAKLVPPKIISLSTCFCDRFDLVWTWDSDGEVASKRVEADEFGLDTTRWDDIKTWCHKQYQNEQLDMYGVFSSLSVVHNCIEQFIQDTADLYILEVGLPHELAKDGWRNQIPDDGHMIGVDKLITQKLPLSNSGEVMGFEVVSYAYHDFGHSWLCSYLHRDMYKLYGIKPNEYALLDNYDDAKKVYEWIAEDEMKGTRAEPIPYDFWLVVSHPLS